MSEFDEWYKQEIGSENKPEYEASKWAWYHQQTKLDELQKKHDAMHNAFVVADDYRKEWHRCYIGVRQREDKLQAKIDKLQGRIDELRRYVSSDDFIDIRVDYPLQSRELSNILKGNKDD